MRLLLDTHALLWWLSDSSRLSSDSRQAITEPENVVFLSSVVVWEIRIKESIGKLDLPQGFRDVLDAEAFVELPMTSEHAHAVRDLPMLHRDPFDRLLIAQARTEGLTLVTRDPEIGRYDVRLLGA